MDLACANKCRAVIRKYERMYKIPSNTLLAIALVESGVTCKGSDFRLRHPWPWTVSLNTQGSGVHFTNKIDAKQYLKQHFKKGISNIDVGCMQINVMYHKHNFDSIDAILDMNKNIEYAAKQIHGKYKRYNSWNKAVASYHSNNPIKGQQYLLRILNAKREISKMKKMQIA